MTLSLVRKRNLIARVAAASLPSLPPGPAARRRQAVAAWRTVTVVAAVDGMDAPWFRDCLEALGLLPYPKTRTRGYHYGEIREA